MTFNLDEQLDALFELCFPKTKRCPNCNGSGFEFQTEVESVRCSLCQGTKQYSELDALKFLGATQEASADSLSSSSAGLPAQRPQVINRKDSSIMTKPIGYFTSHTPGDGTIFDQLENRFGAQLEGMGQEEKYCLMAAILNWLAATDEKQITAAIEEFSLTDAAQQMEAALRDELWAMLPQIQELGVFDLLGLCEAMLGQAREAVCVRFAELKSLQRSYQGALESQGVPSEVAEQAAGILAYEAKNPGYQRTLEEQQIIKAVWRYANIQEVMH